METRPSLRLTVLAVGGLLALALVLWMAPTAQTSPDSTAPSPEARNKYLRGLELAARGTPEDLQEAIPHFRRAVQASTSYVQAYIALADAYVRLGRAEAMPPGECYPKARSPTNEEWRT